jgi:tetratricopeptide (TPR) repeat protein
MFRLITAALLAWSALAQDAGELPALLQRHAKEPGNVQLNQRIGVAYIRLEQLDKAAEFFRKALAADPGFLPARKNLGTVLWFLNRKQESEKEFRILLKSAPADPVPHLYLGLAANERRHFIEAVEHFEKAGDLAAKNPEVRPVLVEAYLGAGQAYDAQGAPQKAYDAFAKAIAIDPMNEESYVALTSFAAAHGNNEFALKTVDAGLEKMPRSSRLALQHGIIAGLSGDSDQAERDFARAAELDPASVLPVLARGVTLLQRGKNAEAAEDFRMAGVRSPDDWRAQYLYALALSRSERPDDARILAALQRAIELNSGESKPRVLLAQRELAAGRVDRAVSELEHAVQSSPQNAQALYQLGLAYRKQGREGEAEQVMRRFRESKAKADQTENEMVLVMKTTKAPGL